MFTFILKNKKMLQSISVADVKINVNYKFDNLEEPIIETIWKNIEKGFHQTLDRYITKFANKDSQAHLNFAISKNTKWLYDWNFNLKVGNENVIYKREWFENVLDLVNHFFDHAKEYFSKK